MRIVMRIIGVHHLFSALTNSNHCGYKQEPMIFSMNWYVIISYGFTIIIFLTVLPQGPSSIRE